MGVKESMNKSIGKVVNLVSSVSQKSSKKATDTFSPSAQIGKACIEAGAESAVLLKNEKNVLPIQKDEIVSVFGRVQYDTFYVGYGSGGDVKAHYKVSINEGLKSCDGITLNTELDGIIRKWVKANPVDNGFWGHWPMSYKEMPVSDALAKRAASVSEKAVVVIGRAAGEDRENTLTKGSYYLTDEEEKMLYAVSRYFDKWTVVLNIGGIFDFSWIEKYSVPSVLICWQGGMETGNALAKVLSGEISPSGKLTDTVSRSYEAQPTAKNFGNKDFNRYEEDIFVGYRYFETFDKESVLFPFGSGLTYSDFSFGINSFSFDNEAITIHATVKNIGAFSAKEALQLYFTAEKTDLDMPEKVLVDFQKTKELAPEEEQTVSFSVPYEKLVAYDDSGKTGYKSAYVLQKGNYTFHAGLNVRNTVRAGLYEVKSNTLIKQLTQVSAPKEQEHLMRFRKINNNGDISLSFEPAPTCTTNLKEIISANLPLAALNTKPNCTFYDVRNGTATLEEFAATLSTGELEAISRGDYVMNSPLGAPGNAAVFGGVLESLREKGVPPLTCTDGPSGIRLSAVSSLLPNGTALASTFNPELIEKLYALLGEEMVERGSDVLLAPGMNIHRNPLCGRNFEYFSEDPCVTGICAAAVVKGLQSTGVSACPKHFCCNNQETNRTHNNSVVSERALREIYLKGFEICVKTAKPKNIMTSYNKINGVWAHYNYELVTSVLRKEWGYEGCVMTDWWMRSSQSPEFPKLCDQAYRVRAGVDVLMPGGGRAGKRKPDGTLLKTLGENGGITLGELQQAAVHVLRFALNKEPEKEKNTMRIMSFNVLCGGNGAQEWKKRIPLVVRTIRNCDPDTFGVQEAHYGWMKALCSAFPDYSFVGVGRDDGKKKGEYSAVFFKKDKYKLLDKGTFWLSETPDKPGKGWDAACTRICSWAKLQEKATEKTFMHFNTHLDHVGVLAMQNGAELVTKKANEIAPDLPAFFTGDFNVTPESAPCKAVLNGGFADCRDIAKVTDKSETFHAFETPDKNAWCVIDYVFCKGDIKVKRFKVVKKHIDSQVPSDHYPVYADVEF